MQTAIGRYTFGGDSETTNQGATMAVDPATGRFTLTVNNPALGIADRNMAEISNLSGNRILIVRTGTATSNADDLDYTMYGHWYTELVATDSLESAAWIGGYITPVSSIPVIGVGNFSGATRGLAFNALAPLSGYIDFDGKVQLAANFAARSITGSITDLTYGEERWELTGLAIGITATIDPARNLFAGTTRVTSATINIGLAPTTGAVGDIAGRFFGPSANEVGGVYTLSDGTRRMIGSFGAKQ